MHVRALALLIGIAVLFPACATRKLHSCAASVLIVGPAEFWLECPPSVDTLAPEGAQP